MAWVFELSKLTSLAVWVEYEVEIKKILARQVTLAKITKNWCRSLFSFALLPPPPPGDF